MLLLHAHFALGRHSFVDSHDTPRRKYPFLLTWRSVMPSGDTGRRLCKKRLPGSCRECLLHCRRRQGVFGMEPFCNTSHYSSRKYEVKNCLAILPPETPNAPRRSHTVISPRPHPACREMPSGSRLRRPILQRPSWMPQRLVRGRRLSLDMKKQRSASLLGRQNIKPHMRATVAKCFHREKNLPTMLLAMFPAMLLLLKAVPARFDAWLNLSHREKARVLVMVKTSAIARRRKHG